MKAIFTILATFLITITSCNCQKDSVSSNLTTSETNMQNEMPIIKYEANARGLALAVKVEDRILYVSRVRDFKDYEEKIKISDSKALRGATDTMPSTTATNKNIAKTLAESTFPLSHAVVGTNNQEIAIQPHTKKRSLANRKREAIPGQSHASLPETSVTRNDPTAQSIPIPSKHRRLQDMSSIQVLDDNFMSAIIGYFGSMSFGSVSWCESGCSILEDALASEVTWIEETCGDFEENT